jgi:hypothetical protein
MQSIDPTKVIESEIFDELDVGDTITVSVGVPAKDGLRRQITFVCSGIDQRVGEVIEGMAMDMASAENTKPSPVDVPEQHLREHEIFFRTILERTRGLEPLRIAVVHPVDRNALLGAVEAAQAELILPTFVGPEDRIRATAQAEQIDISPYALVSTEHSHAAAARSVAMARSGEVDALMKGSLHTDELMHEVVAPDTGLTTDRRMSHVFVLDVPTYPRPLFITDAALNVDPDLDAKRGYCPERDRVGSGPRYHDAQGRNPLGGGNGDTQAAFHAGCRGPGQDGRSGTNRRRRGRWSPRLRQLRLTGRGEGEGHRFSSSWSGRHSGRAESRIRQYADQTAGIPGRFTSRRYRTRGAGTDCPDEPRRLTAGAHGVLRPGVAHGPQEHAHRSCIVTVQVVG